MRRTACPFFPALLVRTPSLCLWKQQQARLFLPATYIGFTGKLEKVIFYVSPMASYYMSLMQLPGQLEVVGKIDLGIFVILSDEARVASRASPGHVGVKLLFGLCSVDGLTEKQWSTNSSLKSFVSYMDTKGQWLMSSGARFLWILFWKHFITWRLAIRKCVKSPHMHDTHKVVFRSWITFHSEFLFACSKMDSLVCLTSTNGGFPCGLLLKKKNPFLKSQPWCRSGFSSLSAADQSGQKANCVLLYPSCFGSLGRARCDDVTAIVQLLWCCWSCVAQCGLLASPALLLNCG